MKITTLNILTIVLISLTILSITFVFYGAQNYQGFYWQSRSALLDPESNNTRVDSITIIQDKSTNLTTVTAKASAYNPTDYQGLTLDSFQIVIFFNHSGNIYEALFNAPVDQLLANTRLVQPLTPHSTVSADLIIQLTSTQSQMLDDFNQTYSGQVSAHLVLTTLVDSFLDPVFGRMTTLKEQEIPIQ